MIRLTGQRGLPCLLHHGPTPLSGRSNHTLLPPLPSKQQFRDRIHGNHDPADDLQATNHRAESVQLLRFSSCETENYKASQVSSLREVPRGEDYRKEHVTEHGEYPR